MTVEGIKCEHPSGATLRVREVRAAAMAHHPPSYHLLPPCSRGKSPSCLKTPTVHQRPPPSPRGFLPPHPHFEPALVRRYGKETWRRRWPSSAG